MTKDKIPNDRNIISGLAVKKIDGQLKRFEVFLTAEELRKILSDKLEFQIGIGVVKPEEITLTDNFLIRDDSGNYEPAFDLKHLC